jgi:nucleotide-binding universal stress UspA family protein
MDIKCVLCPIDFSDASTHAVDQAVVIAGWYKARITALHVSSPMLCQFPASGCRAAAKPLATPKRSVSATKLRPIVKRRPLQASAWTS